MSDFPIENRTYILDQTCIQESGEPDKKDGVFRWADRDRVYKIAKDGFCDTTRPLNPYSREVKDLLEKLKRDSLDHLPLSAAENYLKAFSLAETSFKQKNIDSAEAFLNIASSISVQSGILFNYERAFPILKEYPDKVVIDQICVKGQNFEGGRNGLFHFYEDNLYKTDREGRCDLSSPLSPQSAEVQGVLRKLKRSSLEDLPLYRARDYFFHFRKAEIELEKRNLEETNLALKKVLEITLKGGISLDHEKFDRIFRRIHEFVLDQVCVQDGGNDKVSDNIFSIKQDEVYAVNSEGWCQLDRPLTLYPTKDQERSPEITELLKKLKKVSIEGIRLSSAQEYLDSFRLAEDALKHGRVEQIYGFLLRAHRSAQRGNIQFDSLREKKILEKTEVKAWLLSSLFLLQAADRYTIQKIGPADPAVKVIAFPSQKERETQKNRWREIVLFLRGVSAMSSLSSSQSDLLLSKTQLASNSFHLQNQILGVVSYLGLSSKSFTPKKNEIFVPAIPDGILTLDHYFLRDERGAFADSPEYDFFISLSQEEFLFPVSLAELLGDFWVELDPGFDPRNRRFNLEVVRGKIESSDSSDLKTKILIRIEKDIREKSRMTLVKDQGGWSPVDYLKGLRSLIELSH